MAHRSGSPTKVISLILAIAFGVIALVLVYAAATKPTELRSKAAVTETILKAWEFNGADSENWQGKGFLTLKVNEGLLSGVRMGKDVVPYLVNNAVNTTLEKGLRQFKIRIRVQLASPGGMVGVPELPPPKTTVNPTPPPFLYQATVHLYSRVTTRRGRLVDREIAGSPLTFQGTADGNFYDYTVKFPDSLTLKDVKIDKIIIRFPDFRSRAGTTIDIDWMRVIMTVPIRPPAVSPGPTIPPECRVQVRCLHEPCPTIPPYCPTGVPQPTATPITVEGILLRDNLEGTSPYKLVGEQVYRLVADTATDEGTWWRRYLPDRRTGVDFASFVGCKVEVTGTLMATAPKKGTQPGIPTSAEPKLLVRSIEKTGECQTQPPLPTSFPQ